MDNPEEFNKKDMAILRSAARVIRKKSGPDRWALMTVNSNFLKVHFLTSAGTQERIDKRKE